MVNFKEVDVNEAKKLIDERTVTIVDIRDPLAFQTSHIPNAISVNDQNIDSFLKEADKNKTLICYCYHGFSSQSAAQFFSQNGFAEVYSIIGGFEEFNKYYPV